MLAPSAPLYCSTVSISAFVFPITGGGVFDRAYTGSFPTLPCRAELFTGRFIYTYLNWGPLPQTETLLSEVLADPPRFEG